MSADTGKGDHEAEFLAYVNAYNEEEEDKIIIDNLIENFIK